MELNKSVSILEDESVLQELLADLVENAGMTVRHRCRSAREFLTCVASTPPEVAIVDLKLEDQEGRNLGDGMSVIAELRARLPDVSTVVLSATHDRAVINRCFELGANAFVSKHSAGRSELLTAVKAAARGDRLFPASTMEFSSAAANAPSQTPEGLSQLTPKEFVVLRFVSSGVDNAVISAHLNITVRTVKAHLANLYRKLHCDNRTQLALRARELGVTPQKQ